MTQPKQTASPTTFVDVPASGHAAYINQTASTQFGSNILVASGTNIHITQNLAAQTVQTNPQRAGTDSPVTQRRGAPYFKTEWSKPGSNDPTQIVGTLSREAAPGNTSELPTWLSRPMPVRTASWEGSNRFVGERNTSRLRTPSLKTRRPAKDMDWRQEAKILEERLRIIEHYRSKISIRDEINGSTFSPMACVADKRYIEQRLGYVNVTRHEGIPFDLLSLKHIDNIWSKLGFERLYT